MEKESTINLNVAFISECGNTPAKAPGSWGAGFRARLKCRKRSSSSSEALASRKEPNKRKRKRSRKRAVGAAAKSPRPKGLGTKSHASPVLEGSCAHLDEAFKYTNIMAVSKLEKICRQHGTRRSNRQRKIMDVAVDELGRITGQRAVVTKAKKSIANFKLRQNMPIGAAVTLRGDRMYEFLDRLVSVVLPRVRDFRGVSTRSFDGRGNYTMGLRDQLIFPEISYEKVDKVRGMNVTIVTTARTDDEARELLRQLGMPFRPQGV